MYPRDTLNATGQVFEGLYNRTWELWRDEQLEDAINLARRLIVEPKLGDFHRAGCHLIMAFGKDQYVQVAPYDHANRAVGLYQQLPQSEQVSRLIERAQTILKHAKTDAENEPSPTDFSGSLQEFDDQIEDLPMETITPEMMETAQQNFVNDRDEFSSASEQSEDDGSSGEGDEVPDLPPLARDLRMTDDNRLDENVPYPDGEENFLVPDDEEGGEDDEEEDVEEKGYDNAQSQTMSRANPSVPQQQALPGASNTRREYPTPHATSEPEMSSSPRNSPEERSG